MADMSIQDVRQKFPQYNDLSDEKLAQGIHKKYYPDMPFEDFSKKIGYSEKTQKDEPIGFATNRADPRKRYGDPKLFGEAAKGLVAGTIGTVPDILNIPGELESLARSGIKAVGADISTEPSYRVPYGSEQTGKVLFGEAKTPSQKAARELGSVFGPATFVKGAKLLGKIPELITTARGVGAEKAAEELRGVTKALTQEEIAAQNQIAAKAESDLSRIRQAQEQIANRDQVAMERAARQSGAPVEAMADIKEASLMRQRDRVAKAQSLAKEAGLNEAETKVILSEVESRAVQSEAAVQQLEQRLLSGEQMRPEQFGNILRDAVENIRTTGVAAREELAGFGKAIAGAGNRPIVNTEPIIKRIDKILKNVRDPSIENALRTIQNQLTTVVRGKEIGALNIQSTDSLRKALDRIISTKQIQMANGMSGDAAAAVHHVSEIKDMLLRNSRVYPPYKEALAKYAQLSRPLDIVERKGPLKAVLDADSMSQEFLRGSADVAGRVIQRAKEGHPVFTRLLQEDPEIRNAAKAYFNRELFGAGRVPTTDALRRFLQNNEGVLNQLGLYEDFNTVSKARAAGDAALAQVKKDITQAKSAVSEATSIERQAQRAITEQERIRSLALKRQAAVEKSEVAPEKIATDVKNRALQAESRLKTEATAPTAAKAEAESRADVLNRFATELETVDLNQVSTKANEIAKNLRIKGSINDTEYAEMLRQIKMVDDAYGKSEQAKNMIKKGITAILGTTAAGYGAGYLTGGK